MTAIQPDYFTAYSSLKMNRDARGVLVVEFHTKGGPLTFTAHDHTDFVDAFYRIGRIARTPWSSSQEPEAISLRTSTSRPSVTLPTRGCGVRSTMKASRLWRIY